MSIPSGTDGRKMEQMAGKWNGWQENGMDGNEIEKPIWSLAVFIRTLLGCHSVVILFSIHFCRLFHRTKADKL
jgi:hypothetical protein